MNSPAEKRAALAERVRNADGDLIVAPGIYDMLSVKLANRYPWAAVYMSGYGTVASYLGLPDAGLASYADMVHRAGHMAAGSVAPVIADADTGYGGLLNVRHTVEGYERAGIAAVQLEDQEFPKKCGHTPDRRVIDVAEMTDKISVACEARSDANLLIIARTDARTALGIDAAIERALAYREAGADVLFVESPESETEFEQVARAVDAPLLANMVEGGRSPLIERERLSELGYAIAIYPGTGFTAAAAALDAVYRGLHERGTSLGLDTPLFPLGEMHDMMGFEDVWAFEKRWAK